MSDFRAVWGLGGGCPPLFLHFSPHKPRFWPVLPQELLQSLLPDILTALRALIDADEVSFGGKNRNLGVGGDLGGLEPFLGGFGAVFGAIFGAILGGFGALFGGGLDSFFWGGLEPFWGVQLEPFLGGFEQFLEPLFGGVGPILRGFGAIFRGVWNHLCIFFFGGGWTHVWGSLEPFWGVWRYIWGLRAIFGKF